LYFIYYFYLSGPL